MLPATTTRADSRLVSITAFAIVITAALTALLGPLLI